MGTQYDRSYDVASAVVEERGGVLVEPRDSRYRDTKPHAIVPPCAIDVNLLRFMYQPGRLSARSRVIGNAQQTALAVGHPACTMMPCGFASKWPQTGLDSSP
jgi:hypothetical protein